MTRTIPLAGQPLGNQSITDAPAIHIDNSQHAPIAIAVTVNCLERDDAAVEQLPEPQGCSIAKLLLA